MPLLVALLVFLLQGSICAVGKAFTYSGLGEDVVLTCPLSHSDPSLLVNWRYGRDTRLLVKNGTVLETSSRAARLSVDRKGSLVVRKVTTSDSGTYTCWFNSSVNILDNVLCVLSVSPSPPGECRNGQILDVSCSLMCADFSSCPNGSLVWLSETGNVLQKNPVELNGYRSCVSVLSVNHLVGNNRTHTCQFVEAETVRMQVHYTPVLSDPDSTGWSPLSYVLLILRITGLILMIGIVVVVYVRTRENEKPQKNVNVHFVSRDGSLTYENNFKSQVQCVCRNGSHNYENDLKAGSGCRNASLTYENVEVLSYPPVRH